MRVLGVAVLLTATLASFSPLANNQFVNYDDPSALLQNEHLTAPGTLTWAFTTDLMGHFQPLTWLVWSAVARVFGPNPAAFHGVSLFVHLLNAGLVYLLTLRLIRVGPPKGGHYSTFSAYSAFSACALFAVHPMRVEVVAWASAFPYALALFWLLLSGLAYIRAAAISDTRARAEARAYVPGAIAGAAERKWLAAAIICYGLSLISRPLAIGFPFVLIALDWYPLDARPDRLRASRFGESRRSWPESSRAEAEGRAYVRRRLAEKVPFLVAAVAGALMESASREVAGLQEVGLGARLTMAATAPFVYLGRTIWPVGRSPIEPLPIDPRLEWLPMLLSIAALFALSIVAWRVRHRHPAFLVAWVSFLVLLAPVAGFTPSGQQAIADRYMYFPGVVVSVLAGVAIARAGTLPVFRNLAIAAALAAAVILGAATWRQTRSWHDSITMWTRAADLNPRNDIATYNLAVALADAGRQNDAVARYEQTLQLIPDHEPARRALTGIRARRGIANVQSGKFADAVEDLRAAVAARPDDNALANALAFALMQTGRSGEAAGVLKQSLARHPDDDELAHNLARLLATTEDPAVRDGATALRLALAVRDRVGDRDPRVLDTLAAAYASAGQIAAARKTAEEAAALARQLGQPALADEIAAHARAYKP